MCFLQFCPELRSLLSRGGNEGQSSRWGGVGAEKGLSPPVFGHERCYIRDCYYKLDVVVNFARILRILFLSGHYK